MHVSKADLCEKVQRALDAQNELHRCLRDAVVPIAEVTRRVDERCSTLNLLLEALAERAPSRIEADTIGFGSSMTLRNLDSDTETEHRIMSGDALDLELGHMSIDSAMGTALLGKRAGDVIAVETPGGHRRLRVERFGTLFDFLDECAGGKGGEDLNGTPTPFRRSRRAPVAEAGR